MKNLKILINYNVCLSGDANSIPNNLRVLDWHGCPFQSLPANFRPKALVVLNLPRSRIKQLGEGLQHLTKLTSLNFEGSKFLIEFPDLSSCPNLRYLEASGCTSLVEVHPSVGNLDKLVVLDFRCCRELTKFPNKVRLKSLNFFGLYGCIKLESFPEIVDKMKSLDELDLGRTAIKELPASIGHLVGLEQLDLSESAIKELPASIGHLIGLEQLRLSGSAIKELPSSIGNLTALFVLHLRGCENLANLPQSIYGLQNLMEINLSLCPKLVTLPNNLISEVLSSAESLPLEVQTKSYSSFKSYSLFLCFEECNVSDIDSLENFCCWSHIKRISLCNSNFVNLPVCFSKFVNLWALDLRGCKRLVEILVQLPASIAKIDMGDCISLERFSTLSKILEDGDKQGIIYMDLSNCHRLCDNLELDVSKMAKLFNEMKRSEWIRVILPGSGSVVPEWFTFRNYFDDYDESKFDYIDDRGRTVRNYKLPIEIPWTSVLENTKLFLFAVWEITESFVSRCSLVFEFDGCLGTVDVSGGEIGAGNVWLECIPISFSFLFDENVKTPIFQVTVYGKGLRIKSIVAHLAPISNSRENSTVRQAHRCATYYRPLDE